MTEAKYERSLYFVSTDPARAGQNVTDALFAIADAIRGLTVADMAYACGNGCDDIARAIESLAKIQAHL